MIHTSAKIGSALQATQTVPTPQVCQVLQAYKLVENVIENSVPITDTKHEIVFPISLPPNTLICRGRCSDLKQAYRQQIAGTYCMSAQCMTALRPTRSLQSTQ